MYTVNTKRLGQIYTSQYDHMAEVEYKRIVEESQSGIGQYAWDDITLMSDNEVINAHSGMESWMTVMELKLDAKMDSDEFDEKFEHSCKEADLVDERQMENEIEEAPDQLVKDNEWLDSSEVEKIVDDRVDDHDFSEEVTNALEDTKLVQEVATQVAIGAARAAGFARETDVQNMDAQVRDLALRVDALRLEVNSFRMIKQSWWNRLRFILGV